MKVTFENEFLIHSIWFIIAFNVKDCHMLVVPKILLTWHQPINTVLCSARTCIKVIWKTVLKFNDLSRIYITELRNMFCCFLKMTQNLGKLSVACSRMLRLPTRHWKLNKTPCSDIRRIHSSQWRKRVSTAFCFLSLAIYSVHFPCLLYTFVNMYFVSTACLCTNIHICILWVSAVTLFW